MALALALIPCWATFGFASFDDLSEMQAKTRADSRNSLNARHGITLSQALESAFRINCFFCFHNDGANPFDWPRGFDLSLITTWKISLITLSGAGNIGRDPTQYALLI